MLMPLHAATDITGFGLVGHGMQMAQASKVALSLFSSDLPALNGALVSLKNKNLTKAHLSNHEYYPSSTSLLMRRKHR